LKLVDFTGTRGVIWQHELDAQFEYHKDRPFFHSFAGNEGRIGVLFAEEKDATRFYKKVTTRSAEKATKVSPEPKKENRFTSESWLSLVRDLQSQGITADIIEENKEFIQDWVRQAKQSEGAAATAPKKKSVPRRGAHVASNSVKSTNGDLSPPTSASPSQTTTTIRSACPSSASTA